MTKTKVLIFHTGYEDYLKFNCEITSKKNEIVIIGDESVSNLSKINNVEFVNYEKYINDEKIKYLKSYFKPYNTVDEKYVWLWYLRIFITKLFMDDYKVSKIFHIDSDNILLENINDFIFEKDNAYLVNNDFGNPFAMTASIHSSLLRNDFFNQFIKLYEDIFINKTKFKLIEEKIKFHEENGGGGICDMTLFYLLEKLNLIKVQNLMLPVKTRSNNEFIFMNNLNNPLGYDSRYQYKKSYKGIVKIYKEKNEFTIFDSTKNKHVNIANVHFQGKAKKYLNKKALQKYLT
tara:strand:- start:2077 stop:2946 length:870 start_codon:yes stop_codon:yes gene_type:complete